jgi:4-amino-4-deoxy-L-arabinose transferase-like glycosyltransferase
VTFGLTPWTRRALWAALAAGLVLRTVPFLLDPSMPLRTCDGHAYWHLATNLAQGRGLTVTDPEVAERLCRLAYGPSHHYSPLLPTVEAGFIVVLGPTTAALVAATEAVTAATLAVVWWTTRDLYGRDAALATAGVVSLEWTSLRYGSQLGYSENLVLLTIALTMWGILRSLDDERWILAAAAGAALGYLAKGSVGWFFLIAGAGGFAWRLAHRGLRGVTSRAYLSAVGLFGLVVAAWSTRNLIHFWDGTFAGFWTAWPTSAPTLTTVQYAAGHVGQAAAAALPRLVLLLLAILAPVLVLAPSLARARRDWRGERVSALWLSVFLLYLLGWLFAVSQGVYEHKSPWWGDPIRYVGPARLSVLWLALLDARASRAALNWTALAGVSLVEAFVMPYLLNGDRLLAA